MTGTGVSAGQVGVGGSEMTGEIDAWQQKWQTRMKMDHIVTEIRKKLKESLKELLRNELIC